MVGEKRPFGFVTIYQKVVEGQEKTYGGEGERSVETHLVAVSFYCFQFIRWHRDFFYRLVPDKLSQNQPFQEVLDETVYQGNSFEVAIFSAFIKNCIDMLCEIVNFIDQVVSSGPFRYHVFYHSNDQTHSRDGE
jgi:hypothetical protein